MINFLVNLQIDSESDDLIEAAVPALTKYDFICSDDKDDEDKSGQERLQCIAEKIDSDEVGSILVFDAECIDESESYANLAMEIFKHAGVEKKIKKIKSSLNHEKEKAGLAVLIKDSPQKKIWSQSDDWVSQDFLSFMDHIFEQNFNMRILSLPASDQCIRVMTVDSEDYIPLDSLIKFSVSGYGPRELYSARLVSTLLLSVVGCILSSLGGWLIFSILWSFLVSVGVWSLIAVGLILKYAWACSQDEEAEELRKSDPEAFGKAIAAAFVEEAAKLEGDSEMGKRLKKVAELNRS